jgi:hypothetical protein
MGITKDESTRKESPSVFTRPGRFPRIVPDADPEFNGASWRKIMDLGVARRGSEWSGVTI